MVLTGPDRILRFAHVSHVVHVKYLVKLLSTAGYFFSLSGKKKILDLKMVETDTAQYCE